MRYSLEHWELLCECSWGEIYVVNTGHLEIPILSLHTTLQAKHRHSLRVHLRNLPHLVNVGLLLLELREGRLDFGNDLIIIGSTVWKASGEVEAWNVYGGRRWGDYHFGWWWGGGAWGWTRWSWSWRRTSGFLLWLDLDRETKRGRNRVKRCWRSCLSVNPMGTSVW